MFVFQKIRQPDDGMIDYFETKSQPITKVMVLKAYRKVRAHKGGSGVDGMYPSAQARHSCNDTLCILRA